MTTTPLVRRPGRPRSAEVEARILEATLDRLAEDGIAGLSVEAVAATAGVGKTTIYRRWPNKDALILDAFASLDEPLPPVEEDRPARDELVELLDLIRRRTTRSRSGRLMHCMLGEKERHPRLAAAYEARVIEPRRDRLRQAIRRGMAREEIRSDLDVEMVLHLLTGPMLARTMLGPPARMVPADWAEQIVDTVLAGIAPS